MFLCGIDAVRSPLQSPNDCLHEVVIYLGKSYIHSSHWQSSLDRLKPAFLESVVDERLILSAIVIPQPPLHVPVGVHWPSYLRDYMP